MRGSLRLTNEEREYLSEIAESSLRVINSHQFFVWAQGTLQRLIPHEILLCGVDDGSRNGFEQHHFEATRYFREEHFKALCDPESGLLKHLRQVSERTGDFAILSPRPGSRDSELDAALEDLVAENELRNLAALLLLGPRNQVQAYYSFSRVEGLCERTGYMLELVVPHLHATFLRVRAHQETLGNQNRSRSGRLVTPRQQEILALIRDGKTNIQIANILELSPWTIKNHVQMIFQRLDTSNRTQAITRAISLGILRSE